jgi:hypothetical protein
MSWGVNIDGDVLGGKCDDSSLGEDSGSVKGINNTVIKKSSLRQTRNLRKTRCHCGSQKSGAILGDSSGERGISSGAINCTKTVVCIACCLPEDMSWVSTRSGEHRASEEGDGDSGTSVHCQI